MEASGSRLRHIIFGPNRRQWYPSSDVMIRPVTAQRGAVLVRGIYHKESRSGLLSSPRHVSLGSNFHLRHIF